MKSSKIVLVLMTLIVVTSMLSACGGTPAAPAAAEKLYIPVISKGFQHQFWQAVKLGSENAAKDLNVTITFEGPESEASADRHVAFRAEFDFLPHGNPVSSIFQSKQRQQDEVLEFAKRIAPSHYLYNIE